MFHNHIFQIANLIKRPNVLRYYNNFQKNQWQPLQSLKGQQEKQLQKLISLSYINIPYYTKLFNKNNLKPSGFNSIKDLEKLPILTKKTIKQNWDDFFPKNINQLRYKHGSTGGSTGDPLKYRMSIEDYERGVALLYRGWGYGGYKLGDKVAVIGGSSLIPNVKSELKKRIQDFFLNCRHYSSYKMGEGDLLKYFYDINIWKPGFIRGYASSIYLFAKFIQDNNFKLEFQLKAIFTTAEKLFEKQRESIEQVFGVRVFDTYGLNDGSISAYECEEHNGMHIDTERGILELVNEQGEQIINQQGKILATSLYNYTLPFIRYDTGDLGIISDLECVCGRKALLLKEIRGRVTDFLKLNNVIIGSPVLTVLMGRFDIEQYQIIQDSQSSVICKIVRGPSYNKKRDEEFIKKSFYGHVGEININFNYVDLIPITEAKKYKFIVNNLEKTN